MRTIIGTCTCMYIGTVILILYMYIHMQTCTRTHICITWILYRYYECVHVHQYTWMACTLLHSYEVVFYNLLYLALTQYAHSPLDEWEQVNAGGVTPGGYQGAAWVNPERTWRPTLAKRNMAISIANTCWDTTTEFVVIGRKESDITIARAVKHPCVHGEIPD